MESLPERVESTVYTIGYGTIKNIADAIREKTGDSAGIDPQDMPNVIRSIESCGGKPDMPLAEDYTGDMVPISDGEDNWRVKFLTSDTFTPKKNMVIDVFLVGGGGSGGGTMAYNGSGGGGGYTLTQKGVVLTAGTSYQIQIGAGGQPQSSGGTSSAFGFSVNGGSCGTYGSNTNVAIYGGNGGSAGAGYSSSPGNGGTDGGIANYNSGTSQGFTTREFGETTGELYAAGGGCGAGTKTVTGGKGGAGGHVDGTLGGGAGGNCNSDIRPTNGYNGGKAGCNGASSCGGGGGGGYGGGGGGAGYSWSYGSSYYGGAGAQGIVVIRNAR